MLNYINKYKIMEFSHTHIYNYRRNSFSLVKSKFANFLILFSVMQKTIYLLPKD